MKPKTVTIIGILKWRPCMEYTRARLKELFGERKNITMSELLELPIRDIDRIWGGIRMLTPKYQALWALDVAEHVHHIWAAKYPQDNRPAEALRLGRRCIENPTDENVVAAADAEAAAEAAADAAAEAGSAADAAAAARWVAAAARWVAADAAADAAAEAGSAADAATVAHWAAAAARDAADAEQKWQIQHLLEIAELEAPDEA